jgi:hypothetical protein
MEKLTLDQLEVENFAMQVSEKELSKLKGGTTASCIAIGVSVLFYFFGGRSSGSNSSSRSSLQVMDSTTVRIDANDTTYFYSQTYKYGY